MDKKLVLVSIFVLALSSLFVFSITAWAQDDELGGLWQVMDLHSFRPVGISESYSLKRDLKGETVESVTHSLKVTSSGDGETKISNVLSVTPITDNKSSFWSGTSIGYNSSGGRLSAKEVGGVMICGFEWGCDEDGLDVAIGSGYEVVELRQGVVHSDIRADPILPPIASYDFKAFSTEGHVKTGVTTMTCTENSEQTYEQHIEVEGGNSYIRQSLEVW